MDWSVATGPFFGVPIFLALLVVAAAVFAFLVLQTKVGRAVVLKGEGDRPMQRQP